MTLCIQQYQLIKNGLAATVTHMSKIRRLATNICYLSNWTQRTLVL